LEIRRRTRATTSSPYRPISKANSGDGLQCTRIATVPAFLFQSSTGTAFGVGNYLRRYLKPLAERAGVPGVTHQAFRPPVRLKKRIEQKRVHSKNSGARGRLSARTHNRLEAVQPRGIWPRKCENRSSPRDRRGSGKTELAKVVSLPADATIERRMRVGRPTPAGAIENPPSKQPALSKSLYRRSAHCLRIRQNRIARKAIRIPIASISKSHHSVWWL
jgi:hypothetical protein